MSDRLKIARASRVTGVLLTAALLVGAATRAAAAEPGLAERIHQIVSRPEFNHATFGIEFYSLDRHKVVFALHPSELFTPGSTTKLLTEGTALELFGADYRFHTRVYRIGTLSPDGVLAGDLVLLAAGDPNLSGRIQPDGSLAFENEDHAYGGSVDTKAVPGDPLAVLHDLARQVAGHGIKRIEGRVLIDATLFPEGEAELGTGSIVSPIVVNDNLIDVTATPGAKMGDAVTLQTSPATAYAHFINRATTGAANSDPDLKFENDVAAADGTRTVTVTGTMPVGKPSVLFNYNVPQPSRYAAVTFAETLAAHGVTVTSSAARVTPPAPDFGKLKSSYTAENVVAEHVSPPLSEEVKVTLKVSQNLHASMEPFLWGALVSHDTSDPAGAGFDRERDWLTHAGLDVHQASQGDGAGGAQAAFYTPDFMVHYLAYMATRPDFPVFFRALPILGRDGTLWNIQTNSPAAGQIHAKTGTYGAGDPLNRDVMITGKGLAGYFTAPAGEHMAFAIYANRVEVPDKPEAATQIVGQAVGEIAAAGYLASGGAEPDYDVIIRNGHVIDGTGNPWYAADVGIRGDRIAAIGRLGSASAQRVIDAQGLVVTPGFIDMLGQSEYPLLIDNRSLSKLAQGITSEITGEGGSAAPQNERTLVPAQPFLDHYHLKVDWTDFDGYFSRLERDGTPINLGSYVGAAQVREAVVGDDDRPPSAEELESMKGMVDQAMRQGAMGLSTALIYPPGQYAKTDELIALAKVAASYGGIYATHMRSEGRGEKAALDEAFRIGHEAGMPVEIFHLKVAGKARWGSMTEVVKRIEAERAGGLNVAADMYPYLAGATALASCLPPWVADGGTTKLLERLHDPAVRRKIEAEMATDHQDWENLYLDSGGAAGVEISGVINPSLKQYDGMRLAEVARLEKKAPLTALFDFILSDNAQTGALYFIAGEQDLETGLRQTWTSIGLDANEMSLDGPIFEPHAHPRTFGSMGRFLGYYVRDQHLMPLEQAVRKITSLPAEREHLTDRGLLRPGFYADVTVFDPAHIRDTATYEHPASLTEGVAYVLVNGQLEFENGKATGATAGRALRGQGWAGRATGEASDKP